MPKRSWHEDSSNGRGRLSGLDIDPEALMRGHSVRVIDIGYFGLGHLRSLNPSVQLIREDLRRVLLDLEFRDQLLNDCQCVIHLAAISNDPSAELHPELTEEVNFQPRSAWLKPPKQKASDFSSPPPVRFMAKRPVI